MDSGVLGTKRWTPRHRTGGLRSQREEANERNFGRYRRADPPVDGLRPRRGAGQPSPGADRKAGEAGGVLRRQEPDHRLRAVQRGQLRHPTHRRGDPVQGPQPDPPPAARLELLPGRTQRDARRAARLPAGRRRTVVSRHRGCRHPEHRHHRELRGALDRRPGRRPHLQDGLRRHAGAARRLRRRRDGRLRRGAPDGGHRLRRDARGRREAASSGSSRSRPTRPASRATPATPWPPWASTSSRPTS